jgi:DNA-binding Xre family transcriptional regulator
LGRNSRASRHAPSFGRIRFYAYDRICDALELTPDEYLVVRKSLINKDLIA